MNLLDDVAKAPIPKRLVWLDRLDEKVLAQLMELRRKWKAGDADLRLRFPRPNTLAKFLEQWNDRTLGVSSQTIVKWLDEEE